MASGFKTVAKAGAVAFAGLTAGAVAYGKQSIDAFTESARVNEQTSAVIKSTGGAACVTAAVGTLAGALDTLAGKAAVAVRLGRIEPVAAQHGFHGYVKEPTLFLAGERGTKERVDISPTSQLVPFRPMASVEGAAPAATIDYGRLGEAVAKALVAAGPKGGRLLKSITFQRIANANEIVGKLRWLSKSRGW
jgi:hypothetical protein